MPTTVLPTEVSAHSDSSSKSTKRHWKDELLLPLACLLLVEFIAFGINAKQIGVYMDEWITFHQLHFVKHSLLDLIVAFNSDPRKILRPLECFNMPIMFYFVGIKPFWYHVASYTCEWLSACFLYLALNRLFSDRSIALTASILYLLYPTHDASHFVITEWDETVALCFFTLSLFLYIKGLGERRSSLVICSAIAFLASLCEFEFALPLIVLYPVIWIMMAPRLRAQRGFINLNDWLANQLPCAIVTGSFLIFRAWLGYVYHNAYPTELSVQHFLSIIAKGIAISLSPDTMSFCADLLEKSIRPGWSSSSAILLTFAGVFIFWSTLKSSSSSSTIRESWKIMLFGAIVLVSSYSVFAISAMHTPSITGWFDRVNVGGSLGASLILAGLTGTLQSFASSKLGDSKRIFSAFMLSICAVSLIMINWQCAQPWMTSWQAQRELMTAISSYRSKFQPRDSVIVGDINRYAEGVVVVDLPLELENILRTTLDRQDIYGAVISERLQITKNGLEDRAGNYVWGRYAFNQLVLFSPTKSCWIRTSTPEQFVAAASRLGWTIRHGSQ